MARLQLYLSPGRRLRLSPLTLSFYATRSFSHYVLALLNVTLRPAGGRHDRHNPP
jgi:hypothetical protein